MFVFFAMLARFSGGDIVIGGGYNATEASWEDWAMNKAKSGGGVLNNEWNKRFWCANRHPDGWVICCSDVCSGVFAVYRFSFALCLFFAFILICTVGSTKVGAKVHRGFWFLKAFTLLALVITTLFIKNDAMEAYREVARYLSFIFLLLQILLLIDFGYSWNETWLRYDEACESESCWGWRAAIIGSSASLYILSLVIWVLLYMNFGHDGCPAQQALISVTLVLTVALTIVSCTKIAPHGTLLTSAVVTAYCSYLCYSALASHPDQSCNPLIANNSNSWSDMLVGLLVAAVSMAGTAWSATGSKSALIGEKQGTDLTVTLEDGTGKDSAEAAASDDEEVGAESWWYYHLMMVACSMYLAMLVTDWSAQPATVNGVPVTPADVSHNAYSTSLGTFWVKVVSQWFALAIYAWTLLAPYMLREHRDFGVEFDF